MKFTLLLVALLSVVVAQEIAIPSDDITEIRTAFEAFKTKYSKTYSVPKEKAAFATFQENLGHVKALNALEPNGSPYGISKFMDLSRVEFQAMYLMPKDQHRPALHKPVIGAPEDAATLPASFTWLNASTPVLTGVKNQGQCGSCWTFSATETMESVCAIAGYDLQILAEQQIVDCDTGGDGCGGGWPIQAFQYIQTFGGLETEAEYPYTAANGQCTSKVSETVKCKIASEEWISHNSTVDAVSNQDESKMAPWLIKNGPLSIAADAASWQFYTRGVITSSSCGYQLDHAIQITGWEQMDKMDVWQVRNSWGTDWGMDGYLYLEQNTNTCGCAEAVSMPCVTDPTGATTC